MVREVDRVAYPLTASASLSVPQFDVAAEASIYAARVEILGRAKAAADSLGIRRNRPRSWGASPGDAAGIEGWDQEERAASRRFLSVNISGIGKKVLHDSLRGWRHLFAQVDRSDL